MARRRTIAVAVALERIVATTLALTAGAGAATLVACGGLVGSSTGSTGDASQPDSLGGLGAPPVQDATVDSDTLPVDTQRQDSPSDSDGTLLGDAQPEDSSSDSDALDASGVNCDGGPSYCCFDFCWCLGVSMTRQWVPCGEDAGAGSCPDAQPPEGGVLTCNAWDYGSVCGYADSCGVLAVEAGALEVECITYSGIPDANCGRRPRGFATTRVLGCDPTTAYLSRCAQLEAASIEAFEILVAELEHLGAPPRLLLAARRAARDEVRHATTIAALAGRPTLVAKSRRGRRRVRRSSRAIAIENAVEGCVRETYGALVAMWQARTAADQHVRRAMGRIGSDEARHAQLAWSVQDWMASHLTPAARRAVERARHHALGTLRAELQQSPPPSLAIALGLPSRSHAMMLFGALEQQVAAWADQANPPAASRRRSRG